MPEPMVDVAITIRACSAENVTLPPGEEKVTVRDGGSRHV